MTNELRNAVRLSFFPREKVYLGMVDEMVAERIIGGYAADVPMIEPRSVVACVGSCFAGEISKSLRAQGRAVAHIEVSEQLNTPFALRYFLENAVNNMPFPDGYMPPHLSPEDPGALAQNLRGSGAFILTLGLSLCWYELATNRMVLQPKDAHATNGLMKAILTHTMRQTTVSENVAQINAVIDCIRGFNNVAPIIFSLSPIPLLLSFSDTPVVASNNISKAVLRAALHEVMEQDHPGVFYWPSYDILEWQAKYQGPIYGRGEDDLRHIAPDVIAAMMRLFSRYYFRES